jgi:hypothetical protein
MRTSCAADIRRLVGFVATASVLALVLFGILTVPAAAQTRAQAIKQANAAIDACGEAGGDVLTAYTRDDDGSIVVICDFHDHHDPLACSWEPGNNWTISCLTAGAGAHAPIGGGVLAGARAARHHAAAKGHKK